MAVDYGQCARVGKTGAFLGKTGRFLAVLQFARRNEKVFATRLAAEKQCCKSLKRKLEESETASQNYRTQYDQLAVDYEAKVNQLGNISASLENLQSNPVHTELEKLQAEYKEMQTNLDALQEQLIDVNIKMGSEKTRNANKRARLSEKKLSDALETVDKMKADIVH